MSFTMLSQGDANLKSLPWPSRPRKRPEITIHGSLHECERAIYCGHPTQPYRYLAANQSHRVTLPYPTVDHTELGHRCPCARVSTYGVAKVQAQNSRQALISAQRFYLGPLVDERPVEVVAVVGDDYLRSELGDVREEPPDHGLLVGLVEDVERSGERRLRGVLEVLVKG